jgi:hypothetical protein
LKGSKITPEDAAKNPQAVLEALEFYTEQNRREKQGYDSEDSDKDDDGWCHPHDKPPLLKSSTPDSVHPKPSRSTPAPRQFRDPPARPPLPKVIKDTPLKGEKLKVKKRLHGYTYSLLTVSLGSTEIIFQGKAYWTKAKTSNNRSIPCAKCNYHGSCIIWEGKILMYVNHRIPLVTYIC